MNLCGNAWHWYDEMTSELISPRLSCSYTCPFVEKFSIDIETYYKPDTGNQNDVFSMSSAEKRQRDIGKLLLFSFSMLDAYIKLKLLTVFDVQNHNWAFRTITFTRGPVISMLFTMWALLASDTSLKQSSRKSSGVMPQCLRCRQRAASLT